MGTAKKNDEMRATARLDFPSPNKYNPTSLITQDNKPQWKMGTSQRNTNFANSVPGPNAYKLPSKSIEGPKFNISLKLEN